MNSVYESIFEDGSGKIKYQGQGSWVPRRPWISVLRSVQCHDDRLRQRVYQNLWFVCVGWCKKIKTSAAPSNHCCQSRQQETFQDQERVPQCGSKKFYLLQRGQTRYWHLNLVPLQESARPDMNDWSSWNTWLIISGEGSTIDFESRRYWHSQMVYGSHGVQHVNMVHYARNWIALRCV
jgi:hypothetical protein